MEDYSSFSQLFKTYFKKNQDPQVNRMFFVNKYFVADFKRYLAPTYVKRCFALSLAWQKLWVNLGALPSTRCRVHMHALRCTGWGWRETGFMLVLLSFARPFFMSEFPHEKDSKPWQVHKAQSTIKVTEAWRSLVLKYFLRTSVSLLLKDVKCLETGFSNSDHLRLPRKGG